MLGNRFAVKSDHGFIISGAEIEEGSAALLRAGIEMLPVPDCTFIEIELRTLSIPVARDLEFISGIEVVFYQLGRVLVIAVIRKEGLRVLHRLATIVVVAGLIEVDERFPVAVDADLAACVDVVDLG